MSTEQPRAINLVVVEDQKEVREGLRYLLGLDGRIRVLKVFERAEDLLERIAAMPRPDIVLMDLGLPGMNGIEATRLLHELDPAINVLILTVFEDEDKILASIKAGANGYLLKNTKPDLLLEQIVSAATEGSPISPRVARRLLDEIKREGLGGSGTDYGLTQREREILSGVVDGLTYKEIAVRYNIASSTAKKHILHIYQKLDVRSKAEFVKKAIREKLV
jgi:DNA-binding NarL/FixJ family response regulator